MAQPSKAASNLTNVTIPHGISFFFKRKSTSTWLDFGDISDVSITPVAEFLEHQSNRKGINAVVKRILTNRSLTVDVTLNEINLENLRLSLYGGDITTGSIHVLETATLTPATGVVTLPEIADIVLAVTNDDGSEVHTYTHSAPSLYVSLSDTVETSTVHVTYEVAFSTGDPTRKIEMLDITTIEGVGRFQIRNNKGGLAQIFEFDDVQIAPNGAIPTPSDAIQALPLTVTVQELNGKFGRVYFKDIS